MSRKADALYQLLPAVYRIRDAEQGKPLYALLSVIADQVAVLEENLAQLHDDQFVETAAPWVLPYIGDLIGLEGVSGAALPALRPRAEVANTIGYRRRKGTAAMLEQLARDVTGWPARAVEFFQLLATTQYMNHLRPGNQSMLSIRDGSRLEFLGGAFERVPPHQVAVDCSSPAAAAIRPSQDLPHNVDVRRVSSGRGKYNIPSVGIFLWRLKAQRLSQSPAVPAAAGDAKRFRFCPLGADQPLFNLPVTEDDFTHLAEPINVPMRLSVRMLADGLADYYGPGKSILIEERDGATITAIDVSKVCVCDLSDWAHEPKGGFDVAIDPALGRMSFAADRKTILVTYHHGFSADIGGGEYERNLPFVAAGTPVIAIKNPQTITASLPAPGGGSAIVEAQDSGRYVECPVLAVKSAPGENGETLTLRAADKRSPILVLNDAIGPRSLTLTGGPHDEIVIDGWTIVGGSLNVPAIAGNALGRLTLRHCTLVPGLGIPDGDPNSGVLAIRGDASLVIEIDSTQVTIDSCITGPLRVPDGAHVSIVNSIVDATDETKIAYCDTDKDEGPGAPLHVEQSTLVGRVHTSEIELASNAIFVARLPSNPGAWLAPVQAVRRQEGCMRFSHAPWGSRLPRQYKCQPTSAADASRVYPAFDSLRFADPVFGPVYGRLSLRGAPEIRRGADDESEMGVFHDLLAPLRHALAVTRLDEYLRFGLEIGIFYAS